MSGLCPSQCTPATLLGNPSGNCLIDFRKDTPSRLFFFACQTTLPNPITNANMKAMFDAGTLVVSVALANVVFDQPNFETLQINDCAPPKEIISTRSISFEDRTGIIDNSASPASYNNFADYDFWLNKLTNYAQINYMIGYCSGDVKIPKDINGNPLYATLSGYLDYIKAQSAGGKSTETKKLKLVFQGDPIGFNIKPSWNYIDAGLSI